MTTHRQGCPGGHGIAQPCQADRITEVSTTVDAGLEAEDLAHLGEAERLGLIVGAAYGRALAERDEANATLAMALDHLEALVAAWPETSWAASNVAVERAKDFIQATEKGTQHVDSPQAPTQEDDHGKD